MCLSPRACPLSLAGALPVPALLCLSLVTRTHLRYRASLLRADATCWAAGRHVHACFQDALLKT
jgi:hypothetical protein